MLRVGVIGCGGAGRAHLNGYRKLAGLAEVASVCDIDEDRANSCAEGARVYVDVRSMLAESDLDIVSVCTPEYDHEHPVLEALDKGVAVFCEKPLADTVQGARRMVDRARQDNVRLGVDYNYRFMPPFVALEEEISTGALGEVVLGVISAHAFCYHHAIDLARLFFGEVTEVSSFLRDDPQARDFPWTTPEEFLYVPSVSAAALLRTQAGVTVLLGATRTRDLADSLLDVEVIGTTARRAVRGLSIKDVRPRTVEAWPPDDREMAGRWRTESAFSLSDAFARSVAAFAHSFTLAKPLPTSGEDGLAVLRIDQAIVQANRYGTTVRVTP